MKEQVINSLKVVNRVLNQKKVNYRLLGSIVITAINKSTYREIGDFDILVSNTHARNVISELRRLGFKMQQRKSWGFSWLEATKSNHIPLTLLLIGEFRKKYFYCRLTKSIELFISNQYIVPIRYKLYGCSFVGIPENSVYEGIKISYLNPKRKLDKAVMLKYVPKSRLAGPSINDSFKVRVIGIEIPYLYLIFSHIYNLFGWIRTLIGKKYEIW